jgi:hypothetical protein
LPVIIDLQGRNQEILMNTNQYDVGIQEDFDNMTEDIAHPVKIKNRINHLSYEGQETDYEESDGTEVDKQYTDPIEEYMLVQELNSKNEMVQAGQLSVGDVRIVAKSNSIIEEESVVTDNDNDYKIIELTRTRGMSNQVIMSIVAFGKKLPKR